MNPKSAMVPGSYIQEPISVLNGGTDKAYNVSVRIVRSSVFTVVGPSLFNLGSMAAGASSTITPALQVSRTIINGTYYINATESYATAYGSNVVQNVSIPVQVVINPPDISVSEVVKTPQQYIRAQTRL